MYDYSVNRIDGVRCEGNGVIISRVRKLDNEFEAKIIRGQI